MPIYSAAITIVGTAEIGGACEEDSDCAPVEGADVSCGFDTCEAAFVASEGDACTTTCERDGIRTSCVGSRADDDGNEYQCWKNDESSAALVPHASR